MNLPNLFTLLRLLLAPFVAYAIVAGHYAQAIALLVAAGVTDFADGYLARRMQETTSVGAYFDPIADKILLSVVYVSLGWVHDIAWWIVVLVFGRDILILLMALFGLLFTAHRKFPPSIWGKISTCLQIAAALVILTARAGVPSPVETATWAMVAGTAWSGLHYIWRGISLLRANTD